MRLVRLASTILEWVARRVLWLFDLLYGSIPAEFESDFDRDETVQRLSAVARGFPIFTRQRFAQGEVYRDWIVIRRPHRFRLDLRPPGYEPYFDGDFCEIDGRVRLVGRFRLSGFTRIFMTIWLGFFVVILVLSLRQLLTGDTRVWWFPLAPFGFLAFGVLHVWLGRQRSRDDIPWVTELIRDALSARSPSNRAQQPLGSREGRQ